MAKKDIKLVKDDENNMTDTNNQLALDDDQRIKTLSPSALVAKRFIRNRLALTGLAFIIGMFLFSYLGGWVMSVFFGYDESTKFYTDESQMKLYAGVGENVELRFVVKDDMDVPAIARADSIKAFNAGDEVFESMGSIYLITPLNEETYLISSGEKAADVFAIGSSASINWAADGLGSGFTSALQEAFASFETLFEYNGSTYKAVKTSKNDYTVYNFTQAAIASKNVYDYTEMGVESNFDFIYGAETVIISMDKGGKTEFTYDGKKYNIEKLEDGYYEIYSDEGIYAQASRYLVQPLYEDVFLTIDFKRAAKDAATSKLEEFSYPDENGEEIRYEIRRETYQWIVMKEGKQLVLDTFSFPSKTHPMGTDGNGMDLLTRLMYGGRISLIIGFIVVFIELFIGVILGGISGFFGGFIDNMIMRIVDIFNCIPWLPLLIILGTMMDYLNIDPQVRMIYLMLLLGILGWPGIARMVRGQILSLREQEFMTATKATGISVRKQIFKHLVPNVIPQLIVIATLALGGIIITEATLSFLGLGVKFPFASWGNIINAATDSYVMTTYLFVWIPAGLCILITVLGFNFIGDGLRDAFDPKMKR